MENETAKVLREWGAIPATATQVICFQCPPPTIDCSPVPGARNWHPSGTESAILNRESGDSESCDSKVALDIDSMQCRWRFCVDFPRFYFTAIRLIFVASRCGISWRFRAWNRASRDSRFAILCREDRYHLAEYHRPLNGPF